MPNRRLTDEVLSTVFCLVEQFLNARPLVPASSDVTDLEALTPNDFVLGEMTSLPSFEFSNELSGHDHRPETANESEQSNSGTVPARRARV